MDKTHIKKIPLDKEKNDFEYWQSQSYERRLMALEEIRTEYNNWKYHDQLGFQRVYKIIKQK